MKVDLAAAAKYIAVHAQHSPTGYCARAVRLALEAGGMNTDGHPVVAHEYGPFLEKHGFKRIVDFSGPLLGDVVVLPALSKDGDLQYGHIAMYDGAVWYSDFKQSDMWGGVPWRNDRRFALYRQVE